MTSPISHAADRRRFVVCDVFTDEAYGGNPLAVIEDGSGLTTGQMQRIAREFNLSETVFFLPPEDPAHDLAVRIFTPQSEMPFAGHPTVGAAVMARSLGVVSATATAISMEEQVGVVPVELDEDADRATLTVAQLPEAGGLVSADDLAVVLGLERSVVEDGRIWSCGLPFIVGAVDSVDTLAAIRVDAAAMADRLGGFATPDVYVTAGDRHRMRARMFAQLDGIPEDPATGSAACAFAGWWLDRHQPEDGTHRVRIDQGVEMGRPSELALEVTVTDGALRQVRVGGGVVAVSDGWIAV